MNTKVEQLNNSLTVFAMPACSGPRAVRKLLLVAANCVYVHWGTGNAMTRSAAFSRREQGFKADTDAYSVQFGPQAHSNLTR